MEDEESAWKDDWTNTSWFTADTPLLSNCSKPRAEDGSVDNSSNNRNAENKSRNRNRVNVLTLSILVFYNVAGGPIGMEGAIQAAGNLYAILGFAVAPIVMSLPEALVTAELGSAFPHPSGGVQWTREAFGETMGLWCGYWRWISMATSIAVFPALTLDYLSNLSNTNSAFRGFGGSSTLRFAILSLMTLLLSLLNATGLEIVGNTSVVIAVVSMCPFIIMCLVGLPRIHPSRWLQLPSSSSSSSSFTSWFSKLRLADISWSAYLNNLFWNNNFFDTAANFSSELPKHELGTTYPRGILLGLVLAVSCYIIPLLVATGATDTPQSHWTDGYMVRAAIEVASGGSDTNSGTWLGIGAALGAALSNLGTFEAEMSVNSLLLLGMANRGHVPACFGKRNERFGTPVNGIVAGTIVVVVLSVAEFGQLIEMLNFNYSVCLLIQYAAFVKLRYSRSEVVRPYRIPIPNWAALLMVIPPSLIIIVIMSLASPSTFIYFAVVQILGFLSYVFLQCAKIYGWCEFETIIDHQDDFQTSSRNESSLS